MQNQSAEYKEQMKQYLRNRFFMEVSIKVVNLEGQESCICYDDGNDFTFFSKQNEIFDKKTGEKLYATCEDDLPVLDGSRMFLAESQGDIKLFNGAVSEQLLGSIVIIVGVKSDVKGLTIDFGEIYPTEFMVESDSLVKVYTNESRIFSTEDIFYSSTYFKITPISMSNNSRNVRLRIINFLLGVYNVFGNGKIMTYSFKDYCSPICETLPSQDMTIVVDNYDLKYSVDNESSFLQFMETGQEVRAKFGYELNNGIIEWIKENYCYLQTLTANDKRATIYATDIFASIDGIYYGGKYRTAGISLFDLAVEVFTDMGYASGMYVIDDYLKNVVVYNPLPPMKYSEALQTIANAGRCIILQNRDGNVEIRTSFVSDFVATSDNEASVSNVSNVANNNSNVFYAMSLSGFTNLDSSQLFAPQSDYNTGYLSNSISNANGYFSTNPSITMTFENDLIVYGMSIKFWKEYAHEFNVHIYKNGELIDTVSFENETLDFISSDTYWNTDKLVVEFTKCSPNKRIFVDKINIGNYSDYTLTYDRDMTYTPQGERNQRIRNIEVKVTNLLQSEYTEKSEMYSDDISVSNSSNVFDFYFPNASYSLEFIPCEVTGNIPISDISVAVIKYSDYFARVQLSGNGITNIPRIIKMSIKCLEYGEKYTYYIKNYGNRGEDIVWENNPLISSMEHAKKIEEWIATYYLGTVTYTINYRGDPRIDANDLMFLELKDRTSPIVRCYDNTINFNGGVLSGTMVARRFTG